MTVTQERPVVSAPLSFTGSTRRIWRGTKLISGELAGFAAPGRPWLAARWAVVLVIGFYLWAGAVLLVGCLWALVACWYVVVFGLFGLFVIPWRLHRRAQRRQLAATIEARHG